MQLINTLQKAPACSCFVNDILHIIFNDMLVVEPRKRTMQQHQQPGGKGSDKKTPFGGKRRINCPQLAKKLKVIVWKGNDDDYFTRPSPGPPKPITEEAPQTIIIPE